MEDREETPSAPPKRLYKSRERKLCGVCGGLAEYFDMDPTVVRVLWVVVTLFTIFSGAVAYGILALVMPDQDEPK